MEGSCCFVQKLALYASFSLKNIHLSARFKSHCAVWVPPALDSANLAEHSVRRKPRGSHFSIRHAALSQHVPIAAQCMFRTKNSSLRCRAAVSGHSTPAFCRARTGPNPTPAESLAGSFSLSGTRRFSKMRHCGPMHVPHEKQLSSLPRRRFRSLHPGVLPRANWANPTPAESLAGLISLSGTRRFPNMYRLRPSACSARKTALSANAKRAVIIENPVSTQTPP